MLSQIQFVSGGHLRDLCAGQNAEGGFVPGCLDTCDKSRIMTVPGLL